MRIIQILILVLLSSSCLLAQNTTREEFNYMSKGFARMVSEGLDLKKGYYLSDTARFTVNDNKYRFTFFNFKRSADKSLAGTIVIATSNVWGKTYYLGIPAANKDMSIDLNPTLMAQISDYNWDFGIRSGFLLALAEYLMVMNTAKIKESN
jgi:hypothetical protein